MRPPLNPAMGIVPIAARVAIQLTSMQYAKGTVVLHSPGLLSRTALAELPIEIDGIVRLALHSLGVYLDLGYTGNEWLQAVLEASHYGSSFRRCFFFDYKANRSPYPRVTNRGVQTSPQRRADNRRLGFGDE